MVRSTPGPWRYESDEHGRRIRGGNMFLTPVLYPAEFNPGGITPTLEVVDANGLLAAAAPQLLQVAYDFQSILRNNTHMTSFEKLALKRAVEAINLAEGVGVRT